MTALQAAQAADDADFVDRNMHFAVKAAVAISTEAENTARHGERLQLSRQIIANPEMLAKRFALVVMTNPTLFAAVNFAAISDGDLEFTVNSVYNSLL